ncbi:MAG: DUF1178 family protein [Boseongicola sp. SB0662_bin_57]|nr:DUF1178 family protein [Boseongicola sp. SB0662_bin_57]
MIRFALKCANGHGFESWFASSEKFTDLVSAGHVTCPECDSASVTKDLMAPPVRASRKRAVKEEAKDETPRSMAAGTDPEIADAIRKLKAHVEENSDYVGDRFVKEARAMHEGTMPQRSIHGEARSDEARKLVEDGVPALPLPFIPRQKTN